MRAGLAQSLPAQNLEEKQGRAVKRKDLKKSTYKQRNHLIKGKKERNFVVRYFKG